MSDKEMVEWRGMKWQRWEMELTKKHEADIRWDADELLEKVQVGEIYSVGFQAEIKIKWVGKKRRSFVYEDLSEGGTYRMKYADIVRAYEEQKNKPEFKWLPQLCHY